MVSEDVMEVRSRRLGLQHGNSVDQAVFLSKGQACHGVHVPVALYTCFSYISTGSKGSQEGFAETTMQQLYLVLPDTCSGKLFRVPPPESSRPE